MANTPATTPLFRMTQARADDFIQTKCPELSDRVEDYECRGGTHFYFLDQGQVLKVNRHKAVLVNESGRILVGLADFPA